MKLKGWWDEEVEKAIETRKRENRIQRAVNKRVKKQGNEHLWEWENAWEKYKKAKKEAQIIINKKITRWEEEQAKQLDNMPGCDREKEG